jgi:hypothetical protein
MRMLFFLHKFNGSQALQRLALVADTPQFLFDALRQALLLFRHLRSLAFAFFRL